MIPDHWAATLALLLLLADAAVYDLCRRQVPAWLSYGGIVTRLVAAAGADAVLLRLAGALVGGGLLLPFVLRGGFGVASAHLLALVGARGGWQMVVWTAWWAALTGVLLALVAYQRGQRALADLPAIVLGAVRCRLLSSWYLGEADRPGAPVRWHSELQAPFSGLRGP